MRATTKYWIAIRHIGDKGWDWPEQELTVVDMIREILTVLKDVSLAKQIVIAIARTREEVVARVNGNGRMSQNSDSLFADLDTDMQALLAEMED